MNQISSSQSTAASAGDSLIASLPRPASPQAEPKRGWQRISQPIGLDAGELKLQLQTSGLPLEAVARSAWLALTVRYTGRETITLGVEYTQSQPAAPAHPDAAIVLSVNVDGRATLPELHKLLEQETARQRQQRNTGKPEIQSVPALDILFTQSLTRHHTQWPESWLIASVRHGASAELELHYHADACDERVALRLLSDGAAAVRALLANPQMPVGQLALIDPAPMRALNDSGSLERWGWDGLQDIAGVFAGHCQRTPEAPALRFTLRGHSTSQLSYRELDAMATRWAHELARHGAGPGDVIGIAVPRGPAAIALMLGVVRIGAAYMPLDPAFPTERLRFMLANARAGLVVCHADDITRFEQSAETLTLHEDTVDGLAPLVSPLSEPQASTVALLIRPVDTAYVMFTSGSTGKPKGVAISHQAILRLVCNARYCKLDDETVMLHAAPLGFDAATLEIWGPLLNGGTCVIYTEPLPTGHDLAATIRTHGANSAWLTATLFNTIIDDDPAHLAGLTQIMTGGEALSVPHVRRALQALPQASLINGYGPTESTTFTCTYRIENVAENAAGVPIGKPISATWVAVVNEALQPVPAGLVGELLTGGVGLAESYLNSPDQTRRRFIANHLGEGPSQLYRTGDLVRLNEDGVLEFAGRVDDQVKIRGYRVEPQEIAAVINGFPGVARSAVIVEKDAGGMHFVAWIVPQDGQTVDTGALRAWLPEQLPGYMIPTRIESLSELPLTANGKLDRAALSRMAATRGQDANPATASSNRSAAQSAAQSAAPAVSVASVAPAPAPAPATVPGTAAVPSTSADSRPDLPTIIAQVFAHVLGRESFGDNAHFFDEGGNSLLAIAALDRLRSAHQVNCPVGDLYSFPTPAGLARALTTTPDTGIAMPPVSPAADRNEAIAIIGMAVRMPGARDLETFWQNLAGGVDSIHRFKRDELDPSLPAPLLDDPDYVAARGVLEGVENFDAAFFGISPREAELLDPQQRIFLELCWQCLESAAYVPDAASSPAAPVGIFAGMYNASYRQNNLAAHPDKVAQLGEFLVMLGNEKDYIATRTAHRLNLTGPAVSIHTACSTSLVATVQAIDSLLAGQCEMALAGGSSVICPPASGHLFQEGAMLSKDGTTRTFDAQATGTVFSDGAGVVLLKRLSLAQRDGDTIHAIIRGGAINNDGGGKASFMAPSAAGQAQVVRHALARAGVSPRSISYIETHGTATPSGDPIEVDGLKQVYGPLPAGAEPWCSLGSVKSNIGHTVTAAGVAGLIKTTLALKHETIPPTVHFSELNPAIDLHNTPFSIASATRPWPRQDGQPRRAGVSAFGVGGTNAHLIVEEAPAAPAAGANEHRQNRHATLPTVLRVSAATESALRRSVANLADHLDQLSHAPQSGAGSLDDIAHTLAVGRKPMRWRTTVAAENLAQAVSLLRQGPVALDTGTSASVRPLIFVFPGQGSQYLQMGSTLAATSPVFNQAWREAIAAVQQHLGADHALLDILLAGNDEQVLAQTAILQPALFCVEVALARTLIAADLQPAAMIGHSIGEYAAACIAGVLSLDDAARLVVRRGALMQQQPAGSMLSVRLGAAALREQLPQGVCIAADNSPVNTVCAGSAQAIADFEAQLQSRDIPCRALHTSHAFHSPMMQAAADRFGAEVAGASRHAAKVPIYSTMTGTLLSGEQAASVDYWPAQLMAPVLFGPAVQAAARDFDHPVFVELGPRTSLSTLIRQTCPGALALPAMGEANREEPVDFAGLLGRLWSCGQSCAAALPTAGRRISLPTYPFEPTRHWLDAAPWSAAAAATAPPAPATESAALPLPAGESGANANEPARPVAAPIREQLRELLEQASGLGFDASHDSVPFAELGLDSLSLTQIALQVKRSFKTDVSFRQLMQELDSIERLATHLEENAPAVKPQSAAPLAARGSATPAASPASGPSAATRKAGKPPKAFGAIARIQTNQTELTEDQRKRVRHLISEYTARTPKSKAFAQAHRQRMADPRVVNGFKPILKEITYPIVTERSAGAYLWDLDGNRYVDALNGFGMNLFGWQPSFVVDAVRKTLDSGYEIGPQHPLAGAVAEQICDMTGAERAALCNTGSEAVMGATRMARTVTGKRKVVVFDGAYHGIFDEVIVRGTRDHRAIPAAPGIMPNTSENVISLPYGMPESLAVIREYADDIAAVLVEPVQSRRPDFQPREFLRELRELTSEQEIVLIFDEVVTGFRTHPAGIQALFDIKADVTTYGKVIGGGFPIGVIAGKREFMDSLDGGHWQFGDDSVPSVGVTYFAGTFVRHPLALAAADAVLRHLREAGPSLQTELTNKTTAFAQELNAFTKSVGAPVEIRHFSSFWKITFTADHLLQEQLFPIMRQQGVHILDGFPSFMTTAHTDTDIDAIKQAFRHAVRQLQRGRFLPARDVAPGVLFDANRPPVPGARLGRDRAGKPAWYVPNPAAPGKYLRIEDHV